MNICSSSLTNFSLWCLFSESFDPVYAQNDSAARWLQGCSSLQVISRLVELKLFIVWVRYQQQFYEASLALYCIVAPPACYFVAIPVTEVYRKSDISEASDGSSVNVECFLNVSNISLTSHTPHQLASALSAITFIGTTCAMDQSWQLMILK